MHIGEAQLTCYTESLARYCTGIPSRVLSEYVSESIFFCSVQPSLFFASKVWIFSDVWLINKLKCLVCFCSTQAQHVPAWLAIDVSGAGWLSTFPAGIRLPGTNQKLPSAVVAVLTYSSLVVTIQSSVRLGTEESVVFSKLPYGDF